MTDPYDDLAERALRARTSLQDATEHRAVPVLPTSSRRRPVALWAAPALAALAVVGLVLAVVRTGAYDTRLVVRPGVVTSVPAGQAPGSVATDGRLIWVVDAGRGSVLAFDARTLHQRWSTRVGSRPVALGAGLGAVWVVDAEAGRLVKLDPSTGRELASGRTSLDPVALDVAFGAVWVLSAGNQTLDRYDATSVRQTESAVLNGVGRAVTHSRDALWVSVPGGLRRITPTGTLSVRAVHVAGDPVQLVGGGSTVLWVALADGTLAPLDGGTGTSLGPRAALSARLVSVAGTGTDALAATEDGLVHRYSTSGTSGEVVATTGTPVGALAAHGQLLVGTARSTALLYATELPVTETTP